eukprot:3926286-Pyramimonas_sp.AAC.1
MTGAFLEFCFWPDCGSAHSTKGMPWSAFQVNVQISARAGALEGPHALVFPRFRFHEQRRRREVVPVREDAGR